MSGNPDQGCQSGESDQRLPEETTPWSFRVMVVLVAVYLLYRLGQGVIWLLERFG